MLSFNAKPVFHNRDEMWTDIFYSERWSRPWSELWWEEISLPLPPSKAAWTRSWFMKTTPLVILKLLKFSFFFFQSTGCRWWIGMILTWSVPNLMHPFKLTIHLIKVIKRENIWSNWILQKQTGRLSEKGPMAWPDTWRKTGHCATGLAFTIVQIINYLHVYRRETLTVES